MLLKMYINSNEIKLLLRILTYDYLPYKKMCDKYICLDEKLILNFFNKYIKLILNIRLS